MECLISLLPVFVFTALLFALDTFRIVKGKLLISCFLWGTLAALLSYLISNLMVLDSMPMDAILPTGSARPIGSGRLIQSGLPSVPARPNEKIASISTTVQFGIVNFQTYSRYIAPLMEEFLKALLVIVIIRKRHAGFSIDAAMYGFSSGAGFSIIENIFYLFIAGKEEPMSLWLVRGFGTALMHGGCTALFAIILISGVLRDRKFVLYIFLAWLISALLHSVFNHFLLNPYQQTVLILVLLPTVFTIVSFLSVRSMQHWLEINFTEEISLLGLIKLGQLSSSRAGRYLQSMKSYFPAALIVDIYCYLNLYLELSIKAKRNLLLKESGLPTINEPGLDHKLKELNHLRKHIGKPGLMALRPLLRIKHRDLWQIKHMIVLTLFVSLPILTVLPSSSSAQNMHRYSTPELELLYFGKRYSYLMPHAVLTFHNAIDFHKKQWKYDHKKTFVLLTDFEDDGHGGAIVAPDNTIFVGIAPFNFAFSITPSNERFQWLFSHEQTHVSLTDNANKTDIFWRKAFAGKVTRTAEVPVSGLWSYLTTPRWYAPRWFHEGIACYTETWTSGGIGRAMGPYDEMYFRSIVREKQPIYSVVGLDTEGTVVDFQVGANSYLYGTRFITYLAQQYGDDQVKKFYTRSDDSRASYAAQFRKVFGKPVRHAWDDWIVFENSFQANNLQRIGQFPLTNFRPLSPKPLGSMSAPGYDPVKRKMYVAINHPGQLSYIGELDLASGNIRKITVLDSPMLYTVAFLAYNPDSSHVYLTEHNSRYRNLVQVDATTGKKKVLINNSRISNITYDRAGGNIWGVRQDNGFSTIVKIPAPYNQIIPLYTADFGRSLLDLSVSNDGSILSATLTGIKGEQLLILFKTAILETGKKVFDTIYSLEDNTLTQFRFTPDDKHLIGTSYYTGVSNIWRISLDDKSFQLLSNDETGLFTPQYISNDSLYVLKYHRDGMTPGIIPINVLDDANSIEYLANRVVARSPEVRDYTLLPASRLHLDSLTISEKPYRPIQHMRIVNAWPDIAGYKNALAIGYRINARDMTGLAGFSMFVAGSPWSPYNDKQQLHADLEFDIWRWSLRATWNKTHFYDLFGPTRRSRAGYSASIGYHFADQMAAPFKKVTEFSVTHFGDLEVLPQFQNVEAPLRNFQSFYVGHTLSKLRKTLGAVEDERGWIWKLTGAGYLASGSVFPSAISEQSLGMLVPGIRNTSFWIQNSIGQAFGKRYSPFSNFYFGGFRNNYVDWQPADQYRTLIAFPGTEIDEIPAFNFLKTMADLHLRPLRLKNVGTTWLYPTFIKASIFGTHMVTDFDRSNYRNLYNAGMQIDIELVLFSYLKTTWSAGYARKLEAYAGPQQEWMLSVKLLD